MQNFVVSAMLLWMVGPAAYGAVLLGRFSVVVQSTLVLLLVSQIRPRAKAMVLPVFKQLPLLLLC